MAEYYSYDMHQLKDQVDAILNAEIDKINKQKDDKLKDISNNFKRIMRLAQEHIAKGSNYTVNQLDEQQTIEEFERQSEEYERIVRDANLNKNQLRQEISALEIELRKLRDQVADRQIENKNLQYLVDKEKQLKHKKGELEAEALKTLSEDLED